MGWKDDLKKAAGLAKRAAVTAGRKCVEGTEYLYDHREEIAAGVKAAGKAAGASVKSAAETAHDAASAKIYDKEKIEELKTKIEDQGRRYRTLVIERMENRRMVDTLAIGGDLLADIVRTGRIPGDVQAAYAAAYPDLAAEKGFAEAVSGYDGQELTSFVSGVKGKLFEMKYVDHLNSGELPEGYAAHLATSATQPGWDIAITGPDGHLAQVLQMKATDSAEYVRHALERYPDIDVVTTDEVYSHLVMNGAADHIANSGIADADLTAQVLDAVDGAQYQMDWTPPVVSLALIAFTTYTLKDADLYEKARSFGDRAGKSYLCYLFGSVVLACTQTWWLGLAAGITSRFVVARGRRQRELYQELRRVWEMNERLIGRLSAQK